MSHADLTRRHFVHRIASGLLGCTLATRSSFAAGPVVGKATADHIIYLFMEGGMSHLDTFDLRPDHQEIQGPVTGMKTKVPGIHITDQLPQLAAHMGRITQIRSMTHTQGNHLPGKYHVRTGYDLGSRVVAHPAIGAWVTRLAPRLNPALPPYVRVGDLGDHPWSGFLSAAYGPLPISSAQDGLQNSRLTAH